MGFVAGTLLMYMAEEDAFAVLHRLLRGPKFMLYGMATCPILYLTSSREAALTAAYNM